MILVVNNQSASDKTVAAWIESARPDSPISASHALKSYCQYVGYTVSAKSFCRAMVRLGWLQARDAKRRYFVRSASDVTNTVNL